MADYQPHGNKSKTLYYIRYRTKKPEGGYKQNYVYHEDGRIVSFKSKPKADKYCQSLRVDEDAKNSLQALRDRMSKKYGNHQDFLDSYLKTKKKEAPKSYQRSEWHLVHYIFPYFLFERLENNAGLWATHFDDYKEWLEKQTTIRKNKLNADGPSLLSVSSMNKIIGDLNGYLNHLYKKRHLIIVPPKCEQFDGAEDGYRTGEDIVEDAEYSLVLAKFDEIIQSKELERNEKNIKITKLRRLNNQIQQLKETKMLYTVCRRTGMRISEALGISFGDFYPRLLDDQNLNKLLAKNDLRSLSYIVLKSQLGEYNEETERWSREPLKTKRKIDLENSRTIPICNGQGDCDQILKKLHTETRAFYKITTPAQIRANEGQFLFFRSINKNIASSYLKTIYNDISSKGYKWKPFHCLRHTRANEIISLTHDQTLVKLVLGHKSRIFERYVHLEATLAKKLTKDMESVLLGFNLEENPAV